MALMTCKTCNLISKNFTNLTKEDFGPQGWKCEDCEELQDFRSAPVVPVFLEPLPEQINEASPAKDISKFKVDELINSEDSDVIEEPKSTPEPKKRGRPAGNKNKPKAE